MINTPSVFNFTEQVVLRVITNEHNELWFVAADVCSALEIGNVTMALRRLDADEQALSSIEGISKGNDQVNIINESGLYSLVLGSRKPAAKRFKKWVTSEVLPTIRKTGIEPPLTITPAQQRQLQEAISDKAIDMFPTPGLLSSSSRSIAWPGLASRYYSANSRIAAIFSRSAHIPHFSMAGQVGVFSETPVSSNRHANSASACHPRLASMVAELNLPYSGANHA